MNAKVVMYMIMALLLQQGVFAQKAKDIRKYKEHAEEVRQEVWNWDIPAFKTVPALPADNKSSAVVIARHVEVKASGKQNNYRSQFYNQRKAIFYSNTVREMVKLNDKAALEEYSQFTFKKFRRLNSYFRSGLATTIVGVHIIKADGTRKEVNVDEEVVNEEEGKQQQSKLAIPDLQVGDVIDYFVRVEEQKDAFSTIEEQLFVLGDDKPILQYSVHCEISSKYFVRYRAVNGAPNFVTEKDEDGAVLDLLVKNIPSLPVDLWMSPYRQIPMVRMNILLGSPLDHGQRAGDINRNPSQQGIKEDILQQLAYTDNMVKPDCNKIKSGIKDLIKNYQKQNNREIPEDSMAYYVYYAFRYLAFYKVKDDDKIIVGREKNYVSPNNRAFHFFLYKVMTELDIPAQLMLVTSRYGPQQTELLNAGDYEYMLKIQTPKPLFISAGSMFTDCPSIAAEYENQTAPVIDRSRIKNPAGASLFPTLDINKSAATQNAKVEQMRITLNDDMQLLKIDRHTTLKGAMREEEQKRLLLFEDYYDQERKALGVKESLTEQLAESRRRSALAEEYKNAFALARKAQKEDFTAEIKDQFDLTPKEVLSFGVERMGLRHSDPDFVYNTTFTLDGLIKRAGNNYLLDAGKLIGGQLQVKPEQRDRKVDIYQPFARSFEYDIELSIPKGYTLEGADKLNRQVDNACGAFTVNVIVEADKLKLHIKKVYKNSFEPVAKWENLLQVIDAATDFGSQKVLLKKA
jgi:Domain of Unknown Function with PDB structure (DUF3857)